MPESRKDKWIFIVNPIAGNGYAATIVPLLGEMIRKYAVDGEVVLTERPGHAAELSESYCERGFRYIIGVGGDGTLNEIARPLIGRRDIITGIIPAGTGNDFVQILGFPGRFSENDWEVFFRQNTIGMDTGNVNGKIFLNGMGLGFDAQVAAENYTEPGKVKRGGAHKYIWHIVKTLLFFRERSVIINENGCKRETDCFINTVSIGRRFAGGFYLTPEAIANDGLLDVCMIRKLNLFHRFRILLKVPGGKHITDRRVNYYRVAETGLEFKEEVPFHVDGELNYAREFRITIIPGGVNIIYNPSGNHFFRI